MDNTVELLKKLTSTVGVSGEEENIVTLLKDILKKYGNVSVDSMNNVYCTFGQGYHFLLDAHLDEIGMIVTDITDDGFIKVNRCGGIDRRMLLGYEVSVWGKEEVKGIISTLPPHLQNADDEKKVSEFKDISIDVGMSKEKIKKIVSLGDKVTFKRNFTPLLNSQLSASCLDDRAGIASILLCLDRLKNLPCKITVMFSSQEELGTRGAKIGAFSKGVDEFICVDVSFAYTPNCDKADCGTVITLHLKENTEEENYDEFLEPYRIQGLVKKYSDYIRYPIIMQMSHQVPNPDKEGETVTEDEIKDYVRANMAKHKVPRYVIMTDAFPMNAAGKILKYKMREDATRELGLDGAAGIDTAKTAEQIR